MKTKQWYWAYTNDPITWIFDTIEEARDHAIEMGMFDDICGKDAYMDFEEQLLFELSEDELTEYSPYLFAPTKTVENRLLNLIKQHGSIVIKECGAGLFIEKFSDSKGIGNIIDNKVVAKFI